MTARHVLIRMLRSNRKGSFLTEAALALPVMIIGIIALALIINVIAACETIGFAASCGLKKAAFLNQNTIVNTVSLCSEIETRVDNQWPNLTQFKVRIVRKDFESGGIEELTSVSSAARFHVLHTSGIGGDAEFTSKLMARTFTGTLQDASPLDTEAFTQGGTARNVLVYPKYGERYHTETCSIVKQQNEAENPGWNMDLEEAVRQNYTACMLCGGGKV